MASVGGAGQFRHDAGIGQRDGGLPDIGRLGLEAGDDEREKHSLGVLMLQRDIRLIWGAFVAEQPINLAVRHAVFA